MLTLVTFNTFYLLVTVRFKKYQSMIRCYNVVLVYLIEFNVYI